MAEKERIKLKISTAADLGAVLKSIGALKGLKSSLDKTSRSMLKLASSSVLAAKGISSLGNKALLAKAKFDLTDKAIMAFGKAMMKGVVRALKIATMQMGIYAIAMMGVHALFIAGKFLIKAWNATLAATAGVAASAAMAIGLVSAAVREQQAAMYAYKTKTHKEFSGGLNQTRMIMRSLQTDTTLASLGIENLNKAFGAVSKSGTVSFNAQSKSLLKGLMNFAAAGQPLEQGVEKAGELIAVLQDTKKSYSEVKTAAKALGPAMVEAMKKADKAGINSKAKFISALNSGQLSSLGGVEGQFDAVSGTLMGQAKGFFTQIRNMFADFGQEFLEPAKVAFEKMFKSVSVAFKSTSGQLSAFGKRGGLLDFMVKAVQKVSDFYVKLITDYLPKSEGMFKRIGMFWNKFTNGWKDMNNTLRPLIDGARVLEGLFGRVFRPVWTEIKEATMNMNDMLQSNQVGLNRFADSLGQTLALLVKFFGIVGDKIGNNLSFLTRIVEGVKEQFEFFGDILGGIEKMFGSRGTMQLLMGLGRSAKTNFGGVTSVKAMNVTANSVNIGGAIKGGMAGFKVGGPWGAAAGAVGGSGLLGPEVAKLTGIAGSLASPAGMAGLLTGKGTSGIGGVAGLKGLLSGKGSTGLGIPKGMEGLRALMRPVPGAASASPAAAMPSAVSSLGSLSSSATAASSALSTVAATAGKIPKIPGSGLTPTGPVSPVPPPGGPPVGGPPAPKGMGFGLRGMGAGFRDARSGGRLNARLFGGTYTDKSGQQQMRKGALSGGMSSIALSMALSKASDKAPDELKNGLGLASMVSMYSPTAGLALAGGTLATRSGNTALAAGGGAAAGGLIGAKLGGAPGAIIGSALGFAMGAIMAPINKAKIEAKRIKASVTDVMQNTLGELLAQAALLTKTRKGESANLAAMTKFSRKRKDLAEIAGRNNKKIGNRRSFMNMVLSGAGAGAAGGGMAGAIGGTMVGGPLGTLPGAGLGALVGGVGGAAVGALGYGANQLRDLFGKRQRDKTNRAAQKASLLEIFNNQKDLGINMSASQFGDMNKNDNTRKEALQKFEKQGNAEATASDRLTTMAQNRMNVFTQMTGKTETEIDRLAQSIGLNLYDSTISMTDALNKLGITVKRTKEQVNAELAQMLMENLSIFDQVAKRQKAPLIYDEAIAAFGQSRRQQLKDDPNSAVDVSELGQMIGVAQEQLITRAGGDTGAAYFEFQKMFGEGTGALFNQKGGQLEGMSSQIYAGGSASRAAMTGYNEKNLKGVKASLGQTLSQKLAEAPEAQALSASGRKSILDSFGRMDVGSQEEFYNQVMSGKLTTGNFTNNLSSFGISGIDPLQKLDKESAAFALSDLSDKEVMVLDAQKKITDMQAKFYDPNVANNPEWFSKDALKEIFIAAGVEIKKPDTTTPRGDTTSSRLTQTLGRHASMNSLISGKRNITSSYRTNNLGSINSDHVTGRAYDLVGNQLGMYKTTVERNGGFAEFHGGTLNRHLHVVPGPTGDTTVPSMSAGGGKTMSMASAPSAQGNNYTINVYGAGTDEVVAQVKEHLTRLERDKRQRA